MMPPAAVFEIAPAKVLHGAVRLHGLTSSPTPETQVRVAWALAGVAVTAIAAANEKAATNDVAIVLINFISESPPLGVGDDPPRRWRCQRVRPYRESSGSKDALVT